MARAKQKRTWTKGALAAEVAKVDAYCKTHNTTPSQAIVQLGLKLDLKAYRQFQYRQKKANGAAQHFPLEAIPDKPVRVVKQYKSKTSDDKDIAMLLLEAATRLLKRS